MNSDYILKQLKTYNLDEYKDKKHLKELIEDFKVDVNNNKYNYKRDYRHFSNEFITNIVDNIASYYDDPEYSYLLLEDFLMSKGILH